MRNVSKDLAEKEADCKVVADGLGQKHLVMHVSASFWL